MAEDKPAKKRLIKKPESLRERAQKAGNAPEKQRRLRKTAYSAASPFRAAGRVGKKEIYLPLPKNKFGRFLNKRRHYVPKFFREAFSELRQVTWPTRKETWKLTSAVFVFAIVFGVVIAITDFGLDKVFKKFILK